VTTHRAAEPRLLLSKVSEVTAYFWDHQGYFWRAQALQTEVAAEQPLRPQRWRRPAESWRPASEKDALDALLAALG
jgi:hypothetical protein